MQKRALPKPNVVYHSTDLQLSNEKNAKAAMCNPIHTGLLSFPATLSEESWIEGASQIIAEEGSEQFLVNMLYLLRQSLAETEAKPDGNARSIALFENGKSSANDQEALIYCYHDGSPMMKINDEYVCVAEYIFEHLADSPVTDLITEPTMTLIFQSGHTLPLLCPDCQESYHSNDDVLLNKLNGLGIVDIDFEDDRSAVVLYFGPPHIETLEEDPDPIALDTIIIHLDSILQMTCPGFSEGHQNRGHD